MNRVPSWLPDLAQFNGNWEQYLEVIYAIFERDFKASNPFFQGRPVVHDSIMENGKEATFWHLISTFDEGTNDRIPDLRRCERMGWPRPVIEHHAESAISVWKNVRKRPDSKEQTRVLIWFEELDYIVVMTEMRQAMILVTAYLTDYPHTRRKLRKEREQYLQMQKPP